MFKFPNLISNHKTYDLHEDIKSNIRLILKSRVTELLGDPKFASTLYEDLFKPLNPITEYDIRSSIRNAINQYEKRVEISQIEILEIDENNKVKVIIHLIVQQTQSIMTLSAIRDIENHKMTVY